MKQTKRRKQSAVIPVLIGITAMLIVLMGIMGCSAVNRQSPKEQSAPVSGAKESVSTSGYPAEYQIQFEQEWKKNQDFKGFLTLEGTALSTNVVQGTDNTYYRDHGFDGSTETRVAFLDYRANVEAPSTQLMIYLPHAENDAKYGELVNFKNLEYYKQHPVINFNSLYSNAILASYGECFACRYFRMVILSWNGENSNIFVFSRTYEIACIIKMHFTNRSQICFICIAKGHVGFIANPSDIPYHNISRFIDEIQNLFIAT